MPDSESPAQPTAANQAPGPRAGAAQAETSSDVLAGADARCLLRQIPQPAALCQLIDGVVLEGNLALAELLGMPLDQIIGRPLDFACADPGQRDALHAAVRARGPVVEPHFRVRTADGRQRVGELRAQAASLGGSAVVIAIFTDLTDHYRALADLQARESRHRTLAETTQGGVWIIDRDGHTTFADPCMERILACSPGAMLGKHFLEFLDNSWHEVAVRNLEERLSGKAGVHDFKLLRQDGVSIWVTMATNPVFGPDGDVVQAMALVTDITEQRKAQEQLRRQAQMIEYAHSSLIAADMDGFITSWNGGAERLFGVPRASALGRHVDFLHPEEARRTMQRDHIEPLMAHGVHMAETQLMRATGERFWAQLTLTLLRDAEGRPTGMMGHAVDISDRRAAEDALRESEERWRAIAENPFDFVLMVDRSGTFRYANRSIPGVSREDLLGQATVYEHTDPAHHDRIEKALTCVFETGEASYFEAYSYGTGEWYGNFTSPVRRGGEVILAAVLGRNITTAKRAEAELHEAKLRLEEAERVGKIGSWHWHIVRNDLQWSDETYRIFGLTPHSFAATYEAFLEAVEPEDRSLVTEAVNKALEEGAPYSIEHGIMRPDGELRIVHERAEVYKDEYGRPLRMIGTVQDITERKRVEREVQRLNAELEQRVADRTAELAAANAELESFAYSVSHDLRAPLRAINGLGQAVLEDFGSHLPQEGREWLERIQTAAGRMGVLIDELLSLSKISRIDLRRTRVDLAALATDIAAELEQATGRSVALHIEGSCIVDADPALMRVVLQNLLDNAWKYTGRELHPRVEAGCVEVGDEHAFYVRDNGVGFDPGSADRLFGAFQRLHHPDDFDGTGIGLATVRRIIHRHGGQVWARSQPGQGATFYFSLGRRLDV